MCYTDFLPPMREMRKRTIKTKNRIFAIPAACAAMPVNPSTPAMMATIRNNNTQFNMMTAPLMLVYRI